MAPEPERIVLCPRCTAPTGLLARVTLVDETLEHRYCPACLYQWRHWIRPVRSEQGDD